ncbi:MAG: phenylacetate--CoA ligase family protein [Alphaproteobacteria bacterium]|nr:phenylacetate--CoA ligase family protein [Alphaproteobacteria bacterium]
MDYVKGADFESQRAAHYAFHVTAMPHLIGRMSWPREQIDAHRTKSLRNLLRHAKAHSPWHARRLAHIDAERATPADLDDFPVMTKSDLMDNWDEIVTVPGATRKGAEAVLREARDQFYIWGDHTLLASGGTGGRPGLFVYDWASMAVNWASMSRGMSRSLARLAVRQFESAGRPYRTAAVVAEQSSHGSYVMGRLFSNPMNPTKRLSAWRTIEELVPELNALDPHILVCYPTRVPALAAAAAAGELKISPHIVFFGSEHLSDGGRQLTQKTWPKADVLTCWATSEGAGSFPCALADGGFHVSEDLVVLEPVDAAGRPVKPGERSHGVYLTNLFNKAMPIIRYHIDDIFEMDDAPCPCGSAYRKVRQVHGRAFELFHYGSMFVHPLALELAVLEQPSVIEYQLRQTARGAHLLYRQAGPVDAGRLRLRIAEGFARYGLREPEITVEEVAELKRTAVGKLQKFVPLVH